MILLTIPPPPKKKLPTPWLSLLQALPLDRRLKRIYLVSVAQFRPEKDHAMQLRALAAARAKAQAMHDGVGDAVLGAHLKLVGSCRNAEDERRIAELKGAQGRGAGQGGRLGRGVEHLWCARPPAHKYRPAASCSRAQRWTHTRRLPPGPLLARPCGAPRPLPRTTAPRRAARTFVMPVCTSPSTLCAAALARELQRRHTAMQHWPRSVLAAPAAALAKELGIADQVEFCVNASFDQLRALLGDAVAGLHTMVDEHFGISVVEYMAAGGHGGRGAGSARSVGARRAGCGALRRGGGHANAR